MTGRSAEQASPPPADRHDQDQHDQRDDDQHEEDSTMAPENDDTTAGDTTPIEPLDDAGRYARYATGVSTTRPRIRSGAIAWGIIVLAFAATVLIITAVPGNAAAFAAWTTTLTPVSYGIIVVVSIGVLVLLFAGLSAIRRVQRRAANSSTSSS